MHSLHDKLRCWPIYQWVVHSNCHTNLCYVWCWHICQQCRTPDGMHSVHYNMLCGSIFHWRMHFHHDANVPSMQCRNIPGCGGEPDGVQDMRSRDLPVEHGTDGVHWVHHKLWCWAVLERIMHQCSHANVRDMQRGDICAVGWQSDKLHGVHCYL